MILSLHAKSHKNIIFLQFLFISLIYLTGNLSIEIIEHYKITRTVPTFCHCLIFSFELSGTDFIFLTLSENLHISIIKVIKTVFPRIAKKKMFLDSVRCN